MEPDLADENDDSVCGCDPRPADTDPPAFLFPDAVVLDDDAGFPLDTVVLSSVLPSSSSSSSSLSPSELPPDSDDDDDDEPPDPVPDDDTLSLSLSLLTLSESEAEPVPDADDEGGVVPVPVVDLGLRSLLAFVSSDDAERLLPESVSSSESSCQCKPETSGTGGWESKPGVKSLGAVQRWSRLGWWGKMQYNARFLHPFGATLRLVHPGAVYMYAYVSHGTRVLETPSKANSHASSFVQRNISKSHRVSVLNYEGTGESRIKHGPHVSASLHTKPPYRHADVLPALDAIASALLCALSPPLFILFESKGDRPTSDRADIMQNT